MVIYTVKQGDSIYTISRKFGIPMQKIINDNQLENPNLLMIGQALVLMTDSTYHKISLNQTLHSIARMYGTTVDNIISANPNITNPYLLQSGQRIIIPQTNKTQKTIDVNGYAFPTINKNTLASTLPYLTYISIFSYQIRPDGSLVPIPDDSVIAEANNAGVLPMMVITNIREGGSFDSEIAHIILTDEQVQNTLFENITRTLKEKNYKGLDIDIEYIHPEDRESYNKFLEKISNLLHPLGYILTSAVAPKTSENQVGLLYQAHDYKVHGQFMDHVIIMTYEWGYLFGPAQAVAPIDQVEKVLQYALTVIPSEKIFMGMPNYGYDWTLPFVQGSAARSISNVEAVTLAGRVGAEIQYDTKSQAPFFTYYDNSKRQHVVWFDDARSVEARLKLIDKYNLGGVSYWNINEFFSQNWLVLKSMYNIRGKI